LQYYDCGQDFYDGRRRCHFVPRIHAIRQKRVHREHAAVPWEGESNWTSKSDALALESDMSFLGGPCGRSCPSLWRSFADYGPHGVFNWDARWDVKRVFANCDVEWRVHERCVNAHCERDYNKKDRLFWSPSCVVPADEIDIGVQEGNISNHQPVCGSSSLLWDVKSSVEPAIHSLKKGCMSAYYMQLRLDCLWWFTFLSRMAFLISALRAISKLATGLINETLTDVFRFARTSHKWSIALPTKGLHRSPSSVKIS
jgi:hypothetical protein